MTHSRTIRVGLLVCGTLSGPVEAVHGGYYEVYSHYWNSTTPQNCDIKVVIDSYSIKKMEFPDEERLDEYDIFMVTGSATSAYDDTIPWIRELLAFLKGLINNHPNVKLCGICFGHQIVCRALGGECEPNGQWEIGPTSVNLSDVGRSIFRVDQLTLQQIHSDHVPVESFSKQFASGEIQLVGSTGPTNNQGVIKFYPSSSIDAIRTPRDIQVLTLQGHPEFSESIITGLVRQRADAFGPSTATDYWGHKGGDYEDEPVDKEGTGRRWQKTDGLDIVSQVLWKMLGVAPPTDANDEPGNEEHIDGMSGKTEAVSSISRAESNRRFLSGTQWILSQCFIHVSNLFWKLIGVVPKW
ncbi:hypothetical protein D9756_004450 [Leucocoprinus leucothites]|uniref:Glutamine amidotransferase domain-containing protein n=1 Tax=Leucocoprinus leucothites TaxID=201217 RepID=A0A8H5G9G9_9AGAR|nr:hypothetical protein D9756_004450 [Leucoagaricus leucothites]